MMMVLRIAIYTVIALTAGQLAFSPSHAEDKRSKDGMIKEAMSKNGMKKDHDGMKKDGMQREGKSKGGMSKSLPERCAAPDNTFRLIGEYFSGSRLW
jgi:pentapeptide MXKDX repeat protein